VPGVLLALLQFLFALTWIVYVIYLPALAGEAGIDKRYVPMILMMDQVIFIACDWAAGVYADRIARTFGRVGATMAGITLASCAAFLALPWIAPAAGASAFLFLTVLWSATSSALRAPPFVLMARHADPSRGPWIAGVYLFGLGVASALAPYLGFALKQVDARIPFVIASVGLALAAMALAHAEKGAATRSAQQGVTPPGPLARAAVMSLAVAVLFFAIGFQVHFSINSAPAYQRLASAEALPRLMPVFWIGFNVAILPATWLAGRFGAVRVMTASGFAGAAALLACAHSASLDAIVPAQLVAGAAWAIALTSGFALAMQVAGAERAGFVSGVLFSLLAAAALARLAMTSGTVPMPIRTMLDNLPFAAWVIASMITAPLWARHPHVQRQRDR